MGTYDEMTRPELLGIVIEEIRQALQGGIPWLDNAFGRAERLVRHDPSGRRVYSPAVHKGDGNEYRYLTPDGGDGNFCFFWIADPQQVEWVPRQSVGLSAPFSLIFWWDYRRIYGDASTRDPEPLKKQVLDLLNGGFWLRSGSVKVGRIYELAENIYQGFTLDEVDNQFLMHPYGGMRLEGTLFVKETCAP